MHRLSRAAASVLLLAGACKASNSARDTSAATTTTTAAGEVASAAPHGTPTATSADPNTVTVYKSPTCGCCKAWIEHMEDAGFKVVAIDTNNVAPIKEAHGVSADLGSCHTALVGGYVVEGHVPANDVKRLLKERPDVVGLAVPGMPMGSPGMEGPVSQSYDVVAFDRSGGRRVFAKY